MCLFQDQNSVNQFLTVLDGFEITLKREDQLHPLVSGNKFRKLKYNLAEAKKQGQQTLLTFGGPFSNHLSANRAGMPINRTSSSAMASTSLLMLLMQQVRLVAQVWPLSK